MNKAVFGKTMENLRKHREIKLATNEARRNYLVTKLSCNKIFFWKFISRKNEKNNKKKQIFMNKPVYVRLSILEFSRTVMHEFWYDYVKPKYGEKTKLL